MNSLYRLPFVRSFKGGVLPSPSTIGELKSFLDPEIHKNLGTAYTNFLSAIEQNDLKYIKSITHSNLYQFIKGQMTSIRDNNLTIKSTLFDMSDQISKATPPLDAGATNMEKALYRNKLLLATTWKNEQMQLTVNTHAYIGLTMQTRDTNSSYKYIKGARRFYYLTPKSIKDVLTYLQKDQLMALFVEINTKNKLYITNDQGDIIQGSSQPEKYVRSVVRFETNSRELDFKITDVNFVVHKGLSLQPAGPEEAVVDE